MNDALSYANTHFDQFVADLHDYLRFPSVSTNPSHRDDVARCAEWLAAHLRAKGMDSVETVPTDGHPVVVAELIHDEKAPTVLAYGHYDVQPPEPLELWQSPPFEPEVRDGNVYARGAVDDKGQSMMIIKAVESLVKSGAMAGVNVKFVLEGEEEIGSPSLEPFFKEHRERLRADIALVCDTSMPGENIPALTASLRGMAYTSFSIARKGSDVHSGHYGGAISNVMHVLARMIAGLHDENGRIAVPGFYDDVVPVDDALRKELAALPFDERAYLEPTGLPATTPEKGYTALESSTLRPSMDVNGMWGGYSGKGGKTIIPASAGAKISARLVANQDPVDIRNKVVRYLESLTPPGYEITTEPVMLAHPVSIDRNHPATIAALDALSETCGRDAVIIRGGGSIPAVALMKQHLGIDSVMIGFGLESDNLHAPNERFGLDRYRRGIETLVRFFSKLPAQMAR